MIFTIVPHCMTSSLLHREPMATFANEDKHTVHLMSDYEKREAIGIAGKTPADVCDRAWEIFQNVSETHKTPDGGRSLMVGDMLSVTDTKDQTTWWICCSMGWTQTMAPNASVQQNIGS